MLHKHMIPEGESFPLKYLGVTLFYRKTLAFLVEFCVDKARKVCYTCFEIFATPKERRYEYLFAGRAVDLGAKL